jgi:hypothetical protein
MSLFVPFAGKEESGNRGRFGTRGAKFSGKKASIGLKTYSKSKGYMVE